MYQRCRSWPPSKNCCRIWETNRYAPQLRDLHGGKSKFFWSSLNPDISIHACQACDIISLCGYLQSLLTRLNTKTKTYLHFNTVESSTLCGSTIIASGTKLSVCIGWEARYWTKKLNADSMLRHIALDKYLAFGWSCEATYCLQLLPWLDTLVDLLKKMLRYEPSARIRPRQALEHDFFRNDFEYPAPEIRGSSKQKSEEVIVLDD